MPANTTHIYDLNTFKLKSKHRVYTFDLTQHKNSFDDFHSAFSHAIKERCYNTREHVCIGLSSGYDSGMLCCELIKQNIPFKCYSVVGSENRNILEKRYELINGKCELEVVNITNEMRNSAHNWLLQNTEEWKYTICTSQSLYNEFDLSLWDDNGSNNLSAICCLANRDKKKIFLSGGGADEMYDYGGKYKHSNFNGVFPSDLSTIFPWKSVFNSSMESYLMKDEVVCGSYGIEGRYGFISKNLWQEFLWLSVELKNKCYKSAIHDYLEKNNFPFQPNQKIGF
jgi:asparagine synthetase B (glutamine-hydrolysing)